MISCSAIACGQHMKSKEPRRATPTSRLEAKKSGKQARTAGSLFVRRSAGPGSTDMGA
jgi:hypothetical protein